MGDHAVPARFDERQFEEERISAVPYVRFPLGAELAERFCDPDVPAALRVSHPAYEAVAPIAGESRASLAADLAS